MLLQMQLAVIRAMTARAPAVTAAQLEFLLQKVLHILATMAQRSFAGRSPVQLKDMATALFEALIAVDAAKVGGICSCVGTDLCALALLVSDRHMVKNGRV